jgi:hypothetical protein
MTTTEGRMNYHALDDKDLQSLAYARFGIVLRPLHVIGREAVIEELEAWDRFIEEREVCSSSWKFR